MKRRAWVLASSLGVLGLANVPVACVANTAAPPGESDSGTIPQGDSGPVGEDSGTPPVDSGPKPLDSGPTDAGTDAADAAPEPLTLTVTLLGAPEPGVNVVFEDATGAVVTTATTNAAGTVSQLVTAGSQVTVLFGTLESPNLVTIQGVGPGDALTLVDPSGAAPSPPVQTVTTTLPAATWDAAATAYYVYAGPCGNSVPNPIYFQSDCESGGEFPLLARAVDTSTQAEIAYTYQTGNSVEPDGGLPDGDTALPVVITRPWATSAATATLTATNPPGLPDDGGTTSTAGNMSVFYYEVAGGLPLLGQAIPGGATEDGGTESKAFVMHTGYPDFVQGEAFDSVNTSAGVIVAGAATRVAPGATSLAMSLDLSTLPLITSTSLETDDGGTVSQPNVTWTSAGSLSTANGLFISTQWFASTATEAGTTYVNGTWNILAPPTATNVHAPALPASLAAWAPSATASFNSRPRMAAIQASFLSGYAGLRALFAGLPLLSGFQITLPTLPVNGTLYIVGVYQDEG